MCKKFARTSARRWLIRVCKTAGLRADQNWSVSEDGKKNRIKKNKIIIVKFVLNYFIYFIYNNGEI